MIGRTNQTKVVVNMIHINFESLAAHSLSMTGECCPDTMLAHFSATNPTATDDEINHAHEQIEGFVENASQ